MFITFEAGEGAGKTTQVRMLAERLRAAGHDVVQTREPGGSPSAEELRRTVVEGLPGKFDAETELLVFTAARRCHIQQLIRPALARGAIVICDRYLGSTYALQGAGAGVPKKRIDELHAAYCDNLMPDLTVFLDISSDVALARSLGREGNAETRMELKGADFHRRVMENFRQQAAENTFWLTIDGSGTIEDVSEAVFAAVSEAIAARRRPA